MNVATLPLDCRGPCCGVKAVDMPAGCPQVTEQTLSFHAMAGGGDRLLLESTQVGRMVLLTQRESGKRRRKRTDLAPAARNTVPGMCPMCPITRHKSECCLCVVGSLPAEPETTPEQNESEPARNEDGMTAHAARSGAFSARRGRKRGLPTPPREALRAHPSPT